MGSKFLQVLLRHWDRLESRLCDCQDIYPEALLPYAFTLFEAAVSDTITDLSYFDFGNIPKEKLFQKKVLTSHLRDTSGNDFLVTDFLRDAFIEKCKWQPLNDQIKILLRLIEKKMEGEIQSIVNMVKDYKILRNNLVHHDFYRKEELRCVQLQRSEERYVLTKENARELIELFKQFSAEIKSAIRTQFSQYTDLFLVQQCWEEIFGNDVNLAFSDCWDTEGLTTYIGPNPEEYARNHGSTRVACLLSLFLVAFNGHKEIVYYSHILVLPDEQRRLYQSKFNRIMELHNTIDLQNMSIEFSYKKHVK